MVAAAIRELTAPPEARGERLDQHLARLLPDLTRSRIQSLIEAGHVRVGERPGKVALRLKGGEHIVLEVPAPVAALPQAEDLPVTLLHQDRDLVVVNKAAGMVVHPGAGHSTGTLVNALLHLVKDLSGVGGELRPGIVHRLDKDTSGLLVIAKNDRAHQGLAAQFADHGRSGPLERAYLALVWGVPERQRGTVEAALARSLHNREKIAVVPEERGRYAITHYELIEALPPKEALASLVRCELETGRTHQIRVHMAAQRHPCVGDAMYGADPSISAKLGLTRQWLHAVELGFVHPGTGEPVMYVSTYPADLQHALDVLRDD